MTKDKLEATKLETKESSLSPLIIHTPSYYSSFDLAVFILNKENNKWLKTKHNADNIEFNYNDINGINHKMRLDQENGKLEELQNQSWQDITTSIPEIVTELLDFKDNFDALIRLISNEKNQENKPVFKIRTQTDSLQFTILDPKIDQEDYLFNTQTYKYTRPKNNEDAHFKINNVTKEIFIYVGDFDPNVNKWEPISLRNLLFKCHEHVLSETKAPSKSVHLLSNLCTQTLKAVEISTPTGGGLGVYQDELVHREPTGSKPATHFINSGERSI